MSRSKSLIKNSVILTFGTIMPKLMTFLTLPILTAYLSKIEYGTYDLILSGISLVIPIISVQIEQAVFRFLIDSPNEDNQKDLISSSFLFTLFCSILLFIAAFVFLGKYQTGIKYLVGVYAVLSLFYQYSLQLLRGLKLLFHYSISTIVNSLLGVLFIYILVGVFRLGLSGLLISLNLSYLFTIVSVFFMIKLYRKISLSRFSTKKLKDMLLYSTPMMPNSVSWWVVGLSNRWVIAYYLGIEAAAIFAVANKIPSLYNLTYNAFNLSWQESATLSIKDEDVDQYYTTVFHHLSNFLFGVLFLLISFSPILFHIFIDESYEQAYYQMSLIFIALLFHSYSSFYGGIYIALKKTTSIGFSSLIGAMISLTLNILLISYIELYAATVSLIMSYLSISLYRAIGIRKYLKIKYNIRKIMVLFSLLLAICILTFSKNIFLTSINMIVSCVLFGFLNKKLINRFLGAFFQKRR